jgi:hypothetical protein
MSKKLFSLIIAILLILALNGCSQAALSEAPTADTSERVGQQEGHGTELHGAAHGGQVGMAMDAAVDRSDVHLEIVSAAPGQYQVYLSDESRQPISPTGYEGVLAIIRPDGSEIASMPLRATGDHLQAEGGPTDVSQVDVRITLKGSGLSDTLEMDFTIPYTE